jgi:cytochrome P450
VSTAAALPPGPRTPRVAQAVLWGLRYPQFTAAAHRRFGSTFTIRAGTMEPTVVTSDPDAIRRLLTGDPLAKRHANEAVRPLIRDGAVILLDHEPHLARRRLLLPPFHGERVRGYAEMMERLMGAEVARWRPGDVVATLPIAQNLTIEVILQAVLGVADEATRTRFRRHIDDVLFYPLGHARLALASRMTPRAAPPRRVRSAMAFCSSLLTPAVTTYYPNLKTRSWWNAGTWAWWRHYDRLTALADEHIAATRADPRLAERDDVLAMLVQARDEDGHGISNADLREDVLTLIAAGHETTAAGIAWGAVLLAHHPEVRERATAAAHEGDDRYLGALVKEVLRVRPPLPVAAGRVIDEPFAVDGHTVPAGTPILIDAWGLHHDPARHPGPERFDPERFLGEASESYAWLPFGGGHRRCIGAALAELEIRVALAAMLQAATLEPAERELPPPARRGIVVVPHGGGRIRVGGA